MRPTHILRLGREAFGGEAVACQGKHVTAVLGSIQKARPDLSWYAADMQVIGPPLVEQRSPAPVLIGDASSAIRAVSAVEQFESGVLAGVPVDRKNPQFRNGGLWTDDDESADLCDAVVEIRAFDTTYLSIGTIDEKIALAISRTMKTTRV